MKIKTNNQPRENLTWRQLSPKEQKEFNYFDPSNIGQFFRYRGNVYDIEDAMRIEGVEDWHGCYSETAFSGVLIKVSSDGETVIVGRYFS